MGKSSVKTYTELILAISLVGCTIAISPWFNLDPINLPKLLVLTTFAFASVPLLYVNFNVLFSTKPLRFLLGISIFFFAASCLVMFTNSSPLSQQLWGTWGRSNGLLCFFSLMLIFWLSILNGSLGSSERIFRLLVICGYSVSGYTLIQYMDLDPLPWSQKLPFSFLGNINFMSSFLGFVNSYVVSKVLLEKLPISTKIYFIFIFSFNLVLVLASGSIQGIGVSAIGLGLSLSFLLRRSSRIQATIFLTTMVSVGTMVLLGTAGVGPLSKFLVQQTVLFRTDYWRTGISIFTGNFWDGVGLDSLGDYYREYRDTLAATRTGPGRIVNTSHNVFIDLFANGGFFVGASFVAILAISIYQILKFALSTDASVLSQQIAILIFGWLFFMAVSINQIGVTIWGFAFVGIGVGHVLHLRNQVSKGTLSPFQSEKKESKGVVLSSTVFGFLGFVLVFIPVRVDAQVLAALKEGSPESLRIATNQLGASGFHHDKYLEAVLQYYGPQRAAQVARELLASDPRNIFAWNAIAIAEGVVPDSERVSAITEMLKLDPENIELQTRYRSLTGKSP